MWIACEPLDFTCYPNHLITQQTTVSVPYQIKAADLVVVLYSYQVQELANLFFLWVYTAFYLYVSSYPYHIMFNCSLPPPSGL